MGTWHDLQKRPACSAGKTSTGGSSSSRSLEAGGEQDTHTATTSTWTPNARSQQWGDYDGSREHKTEHIGNNSQPLSWNSSMSPGPQASKPAWTTSQQTSSRGDELPEE